jgi:KaiC/GvpD/RAD55 family RecA-like ATPase
MDIEQLKQEVSLPGYIEAQGGKLEKAGKEYRLNPCPVCGHKDHFTIYPESNSYSSFSGCCNGGSIIDYMVEVEGLNQGQAIEKLKQLAGVEPEREPVKEKPADRKEAASLIETASKNTTQYYYTRGLTDKTIKAYNLGYLPGGHKYGPAFKYVLPVSDNFIILRSDNDQDRYRNIGNTEILNSRYLKDASLTDREIFITEGFFDALSLEELDRPAVALNSTAMSEALISILRQNKEAMKGKLLVIALDNDSGGQATREKLKTELQGLGLAYSEIDLNGYKDINEYLTADREGLLQQIEALPLAGTVYEYLKDGFELDQAKRLSEPDIPTKIKGLDHTLGGGLYPGLYVMGAISSLGKTALALQLADKIAEQGQAVLFFSLEMARYEMTSRSLARVLFEKNGDLDLTTGHVINTNYKGRDLWSQDYFKAALEAYREGPAKNLTLLEGDYSINIESLQAEINNYVSRTGRRPVIFIDYLQVLRPLDLKMSEKQHIDLTVVELKRISRDLDLPVIAISSFNRANYKNEVNFEAFKESGAIEYTADVVLGLQLRGVNKEKSNINDLKNQDPRPLELVILKNRRGRAFEVVPLDYWPRQNYFMEV